MLFGIVRFFGVRCRFFIAKQILLLKNPKKRESHSVFIGEKFDSLA